MWETLTAVVVGGIIASLAPLVGMAADGARWKKERRLELLREQRQLLEARADEVLSHIPKAMADNSYPSSMTSSILAFFPKAASDRFTDWMASQDKDKAAGQSAYFDICLAVKNELASLDAQIAAIVDT